MFESEERDREGEENRKAAAIRDSPYFSPLFEDSPNVIIILDKNWQIVYKNRKFNEKIGGRTLQGSTEQKTGECLLCIRSEGKGECGSMEFCRFCGFAAAIRKSERGIPSTGECNIPLSHGESLAFRMHTRPFIHEGERYIFVYLEDISDFKTRQMLENIFLHDINNSITALNGLNEMIDDLPHNEVREIINDLSVRLTDEIHSYRLITEAENHMLSVEISEVDVDSLIGNVIRTLTSPRSMRKKKVIQEQSGLAIFTDETLFRRVMSNAIKNALEASSDDDEIRVYISDDDEQGLYHIHVMSQPLIPKNVQMHLFQRAYSTKGQGRGWGTYSIRLLTERYLGGRVDFVSDKKNRTIFTISIPSLYQMTI